MSVKRGIDVAKWQGVVDWKKVKDSGCEFAILKVIDKSGSKESAFDRNYDGCKNNNIPIGVYNYSYATDVANAKSDAQKVVSIISGKSVTMKVWLDVEDKCQQGIGQKLVDIIKAYQKIIVSAGFEFGVYTGLSFYNSYIKPYKNQIDCPFWIARYPSSARLTLSAILSESKKPVISHKLWGWQYASSGIVSGINGNVDLNICYGNVAVTTPIPKPTPTPTVKKTNPYIEPKALLKKGMKSDSVKWLQWELVQAKFQIVIDGDFGPKTETAVKSFQKLYNLKVDGIVGGMTRSMLKAK